MGVLAGLVDVERVVSVLDERHAQALRRKAGNDRFDQRRLAAAPKGIVLETPTQIAANAAAIRQQAVQSRAMPLGNLTQMTDDERARLGAWIDAGARTR